MDNYKANKGLAVPAALILTLLAATASITMLNAQQLFGTLEDHVGHHRSSIEHHLGRPMYTARSWKQGIRQSVRTGGLKMNHTQMTCTDLKSGYGLGSTPNDRILIWTDDEAFLTHAHERTRGRLSEIDMPTAIAIDFPKPIWIARLDHTNMVIEVNEIRPSFVVFDQD